MVRPQLWVMLLATSEVSDIKNISHVYIATIPSDRIGGAFSIGICLPYIKLGADAKYMCTNRRWHVVSGTAEQLMSKVCSFTFSPALFIIFVSIEVLLQPVIRLIGSSPTSFFFLRFCFCNGYGCFLGWVHLTISGRWHRFRSYHIAAYQIKIIIT